MLPLLALVVLFAASQAAPSPAETAEGLLKADRAFSSSGADKNAIASLSAMFADDVILPVPGGKFAAGKSDAVAALKANPENATAKVEWTPIRAGISADGQHGFTFGYMTMTKADGSQVPLKYLSYWIKHEDVWQVAVYRRRPRAEGAVSQTLMNPSLPARMVSPSSDAATIERFRTSLAAAEQAFSDEAQKIGLGEAFTKYGSADAINMGSPKERDFVVGSRAIGRSVGEGTPTDSSPVSWAADHKVIVASTGDLGITLGFIRSNVKQQEPIPFFTIWRRADVSQPWRYIAE